jgi:hypothetical protein
MRCDATHTRVTSHRALIRPGAIARCVVVVADIAADFEATFLVFLSFVLCAGGLIDQL